MSATATRLAGSCRDLRVAWQALADNQPGIRFREAADALGVAEAELVACGCGVDTVQLRGDWASILQRMPELGRVMCLTRNESVVHERYGAFEEVSVHGGMGLVLGPDIDLRLFLRSWAYGFATTQSLPSGQRKSLQFFDASGQAVFKVYAVKETNQDAWEALMFDFADEDPSLPLQTESIRDSKETVDDASVDVSGLREEWAAMTDTHQFTGLLRRHKLDRLQSLRLIGEDYARPLPAQSVPRLLEAAATSGQPIMVFVGNRGCIQIHSGPVENLRRMGPWFNVLDPDFNLHLREDHIAEAWWVRKPTEDGDVNSVEVYDSRGELIVQFFGTRKPGMAERSDWRELTRELLAEAA